MFTVVVSLLVILKITMLSVTFLGKRKQPLEKMKGRAEKSIFRISLPHRPNTTIGSEYFDSFLCVTFSH